MKLKTLLVFNAIAAFIFGACFVLIPTTMGALYGVTQSPGVILMAQFYGVALLGIGPICWLSKDIADPSFQRVIILPLFASYIVGVIVSVMGTTSGVMNAVGWSAVALYLFLALGYGYSLFGKPSSS